MVIRPTARYGAWIAAAVFAAVVLINALASFGGPRERAVGGQTAEHQRSAAVPAAAVRAVEHLPLTEPPGPDKVIAGVYVSNIQRVDLSSNSFDGDFYVWLRWSNPDIDPTSGIEVMNTYQSWGLTVTPVYEKPRRQPDGSLLWLTRYQGSFNAPLSLADYPFEHQILRIVIEDGEQNIKRIVYEPDKDPIAIDREVTLAGYIFGEPRITFGTYTYGSAFGELDTTTEARTYARMVVEIPVSAPVTSGIVKIILPVVIVLIASGLGLIIPAGYVDSKVNVPITALLALVAMHFVVSTSLPEASYLLMIDVVYILAYATVTAMLAGAVVGAWKFKTVGEDEAMTLERRFLLVTSIAFLLGLAGVLILYLPSDRFL